MSLINNILPVKIKVLRHLYFDKYLLKIGKKELKTRSKLKLEEGKEYLVQISENAGKIIFSSLSEVFNFDILEDGYELFLKTLENEKYYQEYAINGLLLAKNKDEYNFFKNMLFAYANNIYQFAMIYKNRPVFIELKPKNKQSDLFIYFDVFGWSNFVINNNEIIGVFNEFEKVCLAFKSHFKNVKCQKNDYKPFTFIKNYKG